MMVGGQASGESFIEHRRPLTTDMQPGEPGSSLSRDRHLHNCQYEPSSSVLRFIGTVKLSDGNISRCADIKAFAPLPPER